MKILVISDIHGHSLDKAEGIVDQYDATLVTGDITHFGGYTEAKSVLEDFIAGRSVFAVFGNCDYFSVEEYLRESEISVHGRLRALGDFRISGFSGSPVSRFGTPGEYEDEEIGNGVLLWEGGKSILMTHVPAYGTNLDISKVGHIGSHSVRDLITTYQPTIHVCGHVHESRGIDRLGSTILLNPGPYFQGFYAEIESSDDVRCTLKKF